VGCLTRRLPGNIPQPVLACSRETALLQLPGGGGTTRGGTAVLMRRQSCVEAYAEDAQEPASSFGSEKEGSLIEA